jgi:hypothetical protein
MAMQGSVLDIVILGALGLAHRAPAQSGISRGDLSRDESRGPAGDDFPGGIVVEEFQRLAWQEADLGRHAKGDAGNGAVAVSLRAEKVMPVKWIPV